MQSKLPSPLLGSPRSDRVYDLSLRILMTFVSVALVGSVAFLTYRWLVPEAPADTLVPVMQLKPKSDAGGEKPPAPASAPREVLLNPGQIFKCEVGGRITFSEQPCAKN